MLRRSTLRRSRDRWPFSAVGLATVLLALQGCHGGVLEPQGPVGSAERTILLDSLAIMLAIVIPTILVTLVFAWWFRKSNTRAKYIPTWAYSGRIELVVWGIPLLTIMFLGGLTWIGSHQLDPARPLASRTKPLEVQVVALDWKWLFIYPGQGVASVNQLVVPAGAPVHFTLTSASVMTSFFVPQLGSMIYVMNGMADQLNLQADHPGAYYGEAAHFSGDGFSDMNFDVRAVPGPEFTHWVAAVRGAGPVLDDAGYRALEKQSLKVRPFTYRAAAPDLFQKIVMQQLPPGPGPGTGPGPSSPPADVFPKGGR